MYVLRRSRLDCVCGKLITFLPSNLSHANISVNGPTSMERSYPWSILLIVHAKSTSRVYGLGKPCIGKVEKEYIYGELSTHVLAVSINRVRSYGCIPFPPLATQMTGSALMLLAASQHIHNITASYPIHTWASRYQPRIVRLSSVTTCKMKELITQALL